MDTLQTKNRVIVNEKKHKVSLLGFGGDGLQLSHAFLRFFKM
jgi:hypothetical protein